MHDSKENAEACLTQCIHPEVIARVHEKMPDTADLDRLADFYKLFCDNTRMKILAALSCAEMCVCDLGALLRMKQPAISHQLRILKQGRVIKARRDGKMVFYSLEDAHIRHVLEVGAEHLAERLGAGTELAREQYIDG